MAAPQRIHVGPKNICRYAVPLTRHTKVSTSTIHGIHYPRADHDSYIGGMYPQTMLAVSKPVPDVTYPRPGGEGKS